MVDYRPFIAAAEAQDARNAFTIDRMNQSDTQLPAGLRHFYTMCDPADVEIVLSDLTSIKLTPLHGLTPLQQEYASVEDGFVFATREGDPIACLNGEIVTWAHGSRHPAVEKLADNFDSWLEKVVADMKEQ
ncbi:hypothetical protein D3C80_1807060 [compost metagenome]